LLEKSIPVDSFNSNSFAGVVFEVHEQKEKMIIMITDKKNLIHIVIKVKKAI
jgi:hypothetical protein